VFSLLFFTCVFARLKDPTRRNSHSKREQAICSILKGEENTLLGALALRAALGGGAKARAALRPEELQGRRLSKLFENAAPRWGRERD
jgi:hypothetical protein